jgi:hypothetical protein
MGVTSRTGTTSSTPLSAWRVARTKKCRISSREHVREYHFRGLTRNK